MFVKSKGVTTNCWFNYRKVMGLPLASLCICSSVSMHCSWSTISLSKLFWIWFELERSYYSRLVRAARSRCVVTFTIG